MKVAVVGTRGIPGVHGGVERHCEELYPRIVRAGHEVCVYARQGYVSDSQDYRGVRVVALPAPSGQGIEALTHTAASIRRAARDGCDILHIQSIGPSALIPYAKMLGLRRIVVTLHAPDYRQRKWGAAARAYLRLGELFAVRGSSAAICVARWYGLELSKRHHRPVTVIPNGPGLTGLTPRGEASILEQLGLSGGTYALFVGRLIPDKRVEDLIEAARLSGMRVVIAGDASDSDAYARALRDLAGVEVLFPGYVHGQNLVDLYAAAAVFVLPSSVEGLSISALEAMSLGVPMVMSDIAANREVAGGGRCALLYPCGDTVALGEALVAVRQPGTREHLISAASERVRDVYGWDNIAARTIEVYEWVLRRSPQSINRARADLVAVPSGGCADKRCSAGAQRDASRDDPGTIEER